MIPFEEMQSRLFCAENKLAEVTNQRDCSWEESKAIRQAINANHEESTFDEVVRVVAQRDELLAALEEATDVVIGHYGTEGRLAKKCLAAIARVKGGAA